MLIQLFTFFYVAKLFGSAAAPYLSKYGGDYFPFVIIGLAFNEFYITGEQAVRRAIYSLGQAESVLATQTTLWDIILIKSLLDYAGQFLRILFLLAAGALLFGMKLTPAGLGGALLIAILTIICSFSYGVIVASFFLAFKAQLPFSGFLQKFQTLFSGVYFPITVLPLWLRGMSPLVPMTYSLDGLRLSLIKGASFSAILKDVWGLLIFSIIFVPLSVLAFRFGVRKAKQNGTLLFRSE